MKKVTTYFTPWFMLYMLFGAALVVFFVVFVSLKTKEVVEETVVYAVDEGIYIGDNVFTNDIVFSIDLASSNSITLHGEPRMITPEAIIDFSGDKVTYSGDLPVDEAAKIFFDAVMGYVKEARECKP